jgi:hypothetical protein
MKLKRGTYVVYLQNGDTEALGENIKDLWKVGDYDSKRNTIELKSLSKLDKGFYTNTRNAVPISELINKNMFHKKYFVPAAYEYVVGSITKTSYSKDNINVGDTQMKTDNMVKRTTDANMNAAKVAATITAGKTLNAIVAQKVTPKLPFGVKGYADTVFGRVVIANIADFVVKQFMGNNYKANMATEAMMQAAMLELADSFDLEGIVADLVDSVNLEAVAD